jgi:hypothetical protein
MQAIQQKASFRTLHGFLKGKTNGKTLMIEEIDDAIAEAGAAAGAVSFDKKAVALLLAQGRKARLLL